MKHISTFKLITVSLVTFSFLSNVLAQDTFSIVAADSATGEVGSAGASCIDAGFFAPKGAHIISEILPGRGSANCQASLILANRNTVKTRMEAGDSPSEVIQYVTENDVNSDSTVRQYGIVDFDSITGSVRVAAFTGDSCLDYKNHIVGPNYAIQGNILVGQEILDSMEARFLAATGTLEDKLMAALQGANVPGADTRCLSEGRSSQSAFIRVAQSDDAYNDLYMDIAVYSLFGNGEPIDALQANFDNFVPDTTSNNTGISKQSGLDEPGLQFSISNGRIQINGPVEQLESMEIYTMDGKLVMTSSLFDFSPNLRPGLYAACFYMKPTSSIPYRSKYCTNFHFRK